MDPLPPPPRPVPAVLRVRLLFANLPVVIGSLFILLGSGLLLMAGGLTNAVRDFFWSPAPQTVQGRLHQAEATNLSVNRARVHRYTFSYEHPDRGRVAATCHSVGAMFTGPGIVDVEIDGAAGRIAGTQISRMGSGSVLILLPAVLGALVVAGGMTWGRRKIRVLEHGVLSQAPVDAMRFEEPRSRMESMPFREARTTPELMEAHWVSCTFRFQAQDGSEVEAGDTVASLDGFGGEPSEPVLHDPDHPKRAWLLRGSGLKAAVSPEGEWEPPAGIRPWLALGLLAFSLALFPVLSALLGSPEGEAPSLVEASRPKDLILDLGGGVSLDFVTVPAGEFDMGAWERYQRPVHRVRFSVPYFIGKREVTVAQFRRFVDATGYRTEAETGGKAQGIKDGRWQTIPGIHWRAPGFPQGDSHPVVLVSRNDALAFARWAGGQTGREIDLPTEAQWEYAARGGTGVRYPWGNSWDGKRLNHADRALKEAGIPGSAISDGSAFTAPAGSYPGSGSWCGALDLAGNAWEWVRDAYDEYYYSRSETEDPKGPADTGQGIIRGGSWAEDADLCRSTTRYDFAPDRRETNVGFRVVLRLPAR